jgi:1-aminocyclopropane-1-carboxylate deaminase
LQDIQNLFKIPSTPLQKIEDEFLFKYKINLYVKREDLNDPELSGNKLHKLKYNLLKAREDNHETLLTFGGAYSNHIYAVAAAGKRFSFNTIGIIRGEEHLPLNPTLKFAKNCGMKIVYMNRSTYRNKTTDQIITQLKEKFGRFCLIPEGGTNELALKGCSEIINSLHINFDFICTACGTGGTIAGLISGLKKGQKAIGFAVLKGAEFLNKDIKKLLGLYKMNCLNNWEIKMDYHFGGYAKFTPELIDFINNFESNTNIKVEPVYTGKMFFGIYDMIKNHHLPEGSTIVALHTGGLQGLKGLKERRILP